MALILAPILGQLFIILSGFAINAVVGKAITGRGWNFSIPNLIVILLTGFYTGFLAALFAGRRGLLIAGLSNWLPNMIIVAISLIVNRDFNWGRTGISLADWAWISFIPALLGGYLGAPRPRHIPTAEKTAELFN
jgi:hypothetical protein